VKNFLAILSNTICKQPELAVADVEVVDMRGGEGHGFVSNQK
jgi:hypothetical protein